MCIISFKGKGSLEIILRLHGIMGLQSILYRDWRQGSEVVKKLAHKECNLGRSGDGPILVHPVQPDSKDVTPIQDCAKRI